MSIKYKIFWKKKLAKKIWAKSHRSHNWVYLTYKNTDKLLKNCKAKEQIKQLINILVKSQRI